MHQMYMIVRGLRVHKESEIKIIYIKQASNV